MGERITDTAAVVRPGPMPRGAIGPGRTTAAVSLSARPFSAGRSVDPIEGMVAGRRGVPRRVVAQSQFPASPQTAGRYQSRRFGDSAAAAEHLRLFEGLKAAGKTGQAAAEAEKLLEETGEPAAGESTAAEFAETEALPMAPPSDQPIADLNETIVVVTGLPRSGTSMIMQMLAAGGLRVLSDGRRNGLM